MLKKIFLIVLITLAAQVVEAFATDPEYINTTAQERQNEKPLPQEGISEDAELLYSKEKPAHQRALVEEEVPVEIQNEMEDKRDLSQFEQKDDIQSFNFLYYLIHQFKLSDFISE